MYGASRILAMSMGLILAGCATTKRDEMCPAIRAFAFASNDATAKSISLETRWGFFPDEEDPTQNVIAQKRCESGEFEPGRALCDYLLKNASTEFAGVNYSRALRCVGIHFDANVNWDEQERTVVHSRFVAGHLVNLTFKPGASVSFPVMTISASRRR
jgi:hypothetical protein